jgi:hypothetical protein
VRAILNKSCLLPALAVLLAGIAFPQSPPLNCIANVPVPPIVRSQGYTETGGDLTLYCTGGTPTVAGSTVPLVNFTLFLNTNATSKVTHHSTTDWSEALVMVDEPNTPTAPQHAVLNCGHIGAPDSGPSGPGVCEIVSDGNPAHTYDGAENTSGANPCNGVSGHPAPNSYGCGRPNVFQGRVPPPGGSMQANEVVFQDVPFDPPGPSGSRIFRFTNLRADPVTLGPGAKIIVTVAAAGLPGLNISFPQQIMAFTLSGFNASIGSPGVVHVVEGFASAWKERNISYTLSNAMFMAGNYVYNGGTAHPAEHAQNVPGIVANYNSESAFEWQNNTTNGPPSPNPPAGFGNTVPNLGHPLDSSGAFGGVNTNISHAGASSAGTRIALTFTHIPPGESVHVPAAVHLHPVVSPATTSGVMVLTHTDAAGAGAFNPAANTTIHNGETAVYEILYSDQFAIESADIKCTVTGPPGGTLVTVSFAPFYKTPSAGFPTPTAAHPTPTAVPRFTPATGAPMLLN